MTKEITKYEEKQKCYGLIKSIIDAKCQINDTIGATTKIVTEMLEIEELPLQNNFDDVFNDLIKCSDEWRTLLEKLQDQLDTHVKLYGGEEYEQRRSRTADQGD